MSFKDCYTFKSEGSIHIALQGKSLCGVKITKPIKNDFSPDCPLCEAREANLKFKYSFAGNITRIIGERVNGFIVRIWRDRKETFYAYFGKFTYGGLLKAKRAAEIYRAYALKQEIELRGPYIRPNYRRYYTTPFSHNKTTGITGVHLTITWNRQHTYKEPMYVATWREKGKPRQKRFLIRKYKSQEEALALAIQKRKEMELKIEAGEI